jgi:quinol monooxygenase YgiN
MSILGGVAMPESELEPIVYVDNWKIRDGKLGEFKDAARQFVDFVAESEPQLIAYNVYIAEESNHATVIQIHPDSASIEFHMKVAGPQFGRFIELYETGGTIGVHGSPTDHVLDRMRQMGQQLGVTVDVKELYAGFVRLLP